MKIFFFYIKFSERLLLCLDIEKIRKEKKSGNEQAIFFSSIEGVHVTIRTK